MPRARHHHVPLLSADVDFEHQVAFLHFVLPSRPGRSRQRAGGDQQFAAPILSPCHVTPLSAAQGVGPSLLDHSLDLTCSESNQKRLRHAAIAFSYRAYVAAYPPGRFHRAVSPNQNDKLPSGGQWLHEIKHDGFRIDRALYFLSLFAH
jgi:hypothetical protein